ncbi:MAG: hypothetical protein P4L84_28960 [Isosphaeraceae bacterium]|nr:hypothetical protein [Isosphaeraceae bacterium]
MFPRPSFRAAPVLHGEPPLTAAYRSRYGTPVLTEPNVTLDLGVFGPVRAIERLSKHLHYKDRPKAGHRAVAFSEKSLRSWLQLLLVYKPQTLEHRFESRKTDFVVAPVPLKAMAWVQVLLCGCVFILVAEAILEPNDVRTWPLRICLCGLRAGW